MKNKKFYIGILALVFGMTVTVSAFGQDKDLNGKWRSPKSRYGGFENDLCEYTFLAGNYEIIINWGEDRQGRALNSPYEKGTYTTNDKGVISLKPTHFFVRELDKWYSKDELTKFLKTEESMTDAEIKELFEDERMFINRSLVYSITSVLGYQTLELYQGREKSIYVKQ